MDFAEQYFSQLYKKLGVSLWLIFVFTVFYYLVRKVLRGRDQIRRSCEVIEKQLEHIQRVIAENERKEAKEKNENPPGEATDAECLESEKDK